MPPASEASVDLALALRAVIPELRARVRPALVQASGPILREAQRQASWSSRIPQSLVARVGFGQETASVRIVARRSVAPHARAFEGLQKGARDGFFRHPIFARSDQDRKDWRWAQQRTRPFLMPAVQNNREEVLQSLGEALQSSLRAAGWRT